MLLKSLALKFIRANISPSVLSFILLGNPNLPFVLSFIKSLKVGLNFLNSGLFKIWSIFLPLVTKASSSSKIPGGLPVLVNLLLDWPCDVKVALPYAFAPISSITSFILSYINLWISDFFIVSSNLVKRDLLGFLNAGSCL